MDYQDHVTKEYLIDKSLSAAAGARVYELIREGLSYIKYQQCAFYVDGCYILVPDYLIEYLVYYFEQVSMQKLDEHQEPVLLVHGIRVNASPTDEIIIYHSSFPLRGIEPFKSKVTLKHL